MGRSWMLLDSFAARVIQSLHMETAYNVNPAFPLNPFLGDAPYEPGRLLHF